MPGKDKVLPHSSTMAPLGTWLRLLWENGGASPAYWGKVARILIPTTLAAPLRIVERLRWGGAVARVEIDKPPVFVLGVARSGTTHLLNLMSQDPQYAWISTFHAAVPTFFLTGRGRLKRLMAGLAPATRPMDNMKVSMDMPVEEDLAVANASPFSSLHALSFPQRGEWYFNRYCFMRGLSARELKQWERVYMEVLRKATLDAGGRRLVLKSPANTGRIRHLLRLFPDARFIHIVRNPYVVYESLVHMFRSVIPMHQLHSINDDALHDLALFLLRETLRQYLEDRPSIPKGQLAELRFEDLERNPLSELEAVYATLNLPGWEEARVGIESYLSGIAGYRKNRYTIDPSTVERVQRECRFALDTWEYLPPDGPSAAVSWASR
ncbi:MAG: sulfotransferase [Acidobacteria bacterium]|nr:sulfotransferase [Acidobacteriota bacterium]